MRFTKKVKLLELRDVITAQINLHVPVLLSPPISLYDFQKPRYRSTRLGAQLNYIEKKGVAGANVKI